MAWSNPFHRQTKNTRRCWGYTFDLTDDHLTQEQARPLQHSYDILGEKCLMRLNEIGTQSSLVITPDHDQSSELDSKPEVLDKKYPQKDLYKLLVDHLGKDKILDQFWEGVSTIPDWVDWAQISRGQDVFYRYGSANLIGLAYQSLLGGMGGARVVETLARTGGFSVKVARRRLYETTQHILQCTRSLESLQPGGDGFASSIRVRLLHAAVRQRIVMLSKERPGYYSIDEWGIPISDLDCIATISTFSATLIWISLPRQGLYLRDQEIKDYVALWRYIAYILGTPTDYFENPVKAKAIMESLLLYEIRPTETSRILANNIIKSLANKPPTWASPDMLVVTARWLNGNELADQLGLPRPSLYYWFLMAGQCIFFCCICYGHRCIPYLDRKKVKTLKKLFYTFIVEHKTGLGGVPTKFPFKYVPEYSTLTKLGEGVETEVNYPYVERRNLGALILASGFTGFALWFLASVVVKIFSFT